MARGRPPLTWQSAVAAFLRSKKRVKSKTRQKYLWYYTAWFSALEKKGLETIPSKIGETEINYLCNELWKDNLHSTREYYVKIFNMILRRYNNTIVEDIGLRFPTDQRINVDWLTPAEQVIILEADLTPLQKLVTHLELCLGLRRIEVLRLELKDVRKGYFDICGKGEDAGKWRTVPFHPDTRAIINEWMIERNRMIAEAREHRPDIDVPDALIIYKRYTKNVKLGRYSENGDGLDDQVRHKIVNDVGFSFGNHTLRRTCGRSLWEAEVPDATIAKIYGHSDVKTTLDYIGVNLDHMSEALISLQSYQNNLKNKKKSD